MLMRCNIKTVIILIYICVGALTLTTWGAVTQNTSTDCSDGVECIPAGSCDSCTTYTLTLSSGTGGNIVPWTGTYALCQGTAVSVMATPLSCYRFAGWTGTAVDLGAVTDSTRSSITLILNDNYTLNAHFVPDAPAVVTLAADGVTKTQATLNGKVTESGLWSYQLRFRYRQYGQTTWQYTAWSEVRSPLLSCCTYDCTIAVQECQTYEYVLESKNGCGTGLGEIVTFTTGCTTKPDPDPDPTCYVLYVDDNSTYDPGPGDMTVSDPGENGSSTRPFDSIQEAIEAAEDCTTIYVRAGVYNESIDLMGKAINLKGAWLDGEDRCVETMPILQIDYNSHIVNCTQGEGPDTLIAGLMIGGTPDGAGIYLKNSSPTIRHCVIAGNRGPGLQAMNSEALIEFCSIVDNQSLVIEGGVDLWFSDVTLSHTIVRGHTENIYVRAGDKPTVAYCNVEGGWPESGTTVDLDPLFIHPGTWHDAQTPLDLDDDFWVHGDYHLMSQTGRYWPVYDRWVIDTLDSPMIDAGDPTVDAGDEPDPNGDVVNIGAYGNTSQASLSAM